MKHIKNSTREWEQEHSKSSKSVNMDDLLYPYIQECKQKLTSERALIMRAAGHASQPAGGPETSQQRLSPSQTPAGSRCSGFNLRVSYFEDTLVRSANDDPSRKQT